MRAAVITVGDELLSGDTVNTNAAWLGRELAGRGVRVERIIVVPDRVNDIAEAVGDAAARYDAVIVTGGLGPTHDDVTVEGVAAGLGVEIEENPAAVEWFTENSRYKYNDLVEGTTHLPKGARMLPNTEGVAPGAVVDVPAESRVYVLPGVPDEMKAMFTEIAGEFAGEVRTREFLTTDEPESSLVDRLTSVRDKFGVDVGSYPRPGRVRIRIEGEDPDAVAAAATWLRERVSLAPDQE